MHNGCREAVSDVVAINVGEYDGLAAVLRCRDGRRERWVVDPIHLRPAVVNLAAFGNARQSPRLPQRRHSGSVGPEEADAG